MSQKLSILPTVQKVCPSRKREQPEAAAIYYGDKQLCLKNEKTPYHSIVDRKQKENKNVMVVPFPPH